VLEGSDPVLKNEHIVIGAHYDHLGRGGEAEVSRQTSGEIHHGADDNASGTAGVLELARSSARSAQVETHALVSSHSAVKKKDCSDRITT
jgi:Zn-dependent M28 family amino/carboxypeptidase